MSSLSTIGNGFGIVWWSIDGTTVSGVLPNSSANKPPFLALITLNSFQANDTPNYAGTFQAFVNTSIPYVQNATDYSTYATLSVGATDVTNVLEYDTWKFSQQISANGLAWDRANTITTVVAEAAGATDILGMVVVSDVVDGDIVIVRAEAGKTITVIGLENISLVNASEAYLSGVDALMLQWNESTSYWEELSRTGNYYGQQTAELDANGGTIDILTDYDNTDNLVITTDAAPTVMLANWSISSTSTQRGKRYNVWYYGQANLSSNNTDIFIFGIALSDAQALSGNSRPILIQAVYNADTSSYDAVIAPSLLTNSIESSMILSLDAAKLTGSIAAGRYAADTIPSSAIVSLDGAKIQANTLDVAAAADARSVDLEALGSLGYVDGQWTPVNSSGTGSETLMTVTFPANTAIALGQGVRVVAAGTTAANATAKGISIAVDGTTLATNGTTPSPNGKNWIIDIEVYYTGATAQAYAGGITFDNVAADNGVGAASKNWATSLDISLVVDTAAPSDVSALYLALYAIR